MMTVPHVAVVSVEEAFSLDDACPQGHHTVPYQAKACRLILSVNVPAGWSVGIDRSDVKRLQWRQYNPVPVPPPPPSWFANCRIVHETIWDADWQEFWGQARGNSQQEALAYARQSGFAQCEQVRGEDAQSRCVVDRGQCAASQVR